MIFQALRCAVTSQFRNELTKDALHRFAKYRTCTSFRFTHQGPAEEQKGVLVYAAPLKRRVRLTKLLSLSSSGFALCLLPYVLYDIGRISVPLAVGTAVMSAAFMSTPLLLHWVTKRYVVSLRFDPSSRLFTATTFDLLTREAEITFSAEDVFVPDLPGFLTSIEVKGRPLFVDSRLVQDPDAYAHMMGYDKPLDMRVHTKDVDMEGHKTQKES